MSLRYFMDVHVPKSISVGLRLRGIDVLTAIEDGAILFDDVVLLNRSTALQRILSSRCGIDTRRISHRQRRRIVLLLERSALKTSCLSNISTARCCLSSSAPG